MCGGGGGGGVGVHVWVWGWGCVVWGWITIDVVDYCLLLCVVVKVGTTSLKGVEGTEGTAPRHHLKEKPSRKRCFLAMGTRSVTCQCHHSNHGSVTIT